MTNLTRDRSETSPRFFQALVEGVPEAIIVAAPDGTIIYFNPASEKLLGYTQAEVVGRNIAMLVPQQPDRRADAMKWLERWAHESDETQSRFLDLIAQTKVRQANARRRARRRAQARRRTALFHHLPRQHRAAPGTSRVQGGASQSLAHPASRRRRHHLGRRRADDHLLQSQGRADVRLSRRRGPRPPAVDADARALSPSPSRRRPASAPASRPRAR